jgi:hypothetical protein
VHKLLGKGSYGRVYKVERESDKQLYALKEADLGSMSQAERGDAVNEVRLLVSISHLNVVRVPRHGLLKACSASLGRSAHVLMAARDRSPAVPATPADPLQ